MAEETESVRTLPRVGWARRAALIVIGASSIAALGVLGWIPRAERGARLQAQAARHAEPRRVLVQRTADAPAEAIVTLPAASSATETVDVLARADGFVRAIHVDLGDHVLAGQLIAEIVAPERDEEIRAAAVRADDAELRLSLARTATGRTQSLNEQGVVTGQESDDARASLGTATAAVDAARAEVRRLQALRGYQRVVAPLDGIVTARSVDPGALVRAGATVLFSIARPEVEVILDVPQEHAASAAVGTEVELFDGTRPIATGRIARSAGSLAPATRTMRIEIDVPSTPGLFAGMYLTARLHLPRVHTPTLLPARALVSTPEGPSAWVVSDGVAHRRTLAIVRDRGPDLEIAEGVTAGEQVVLSPPDGLTEGEAVVAVERSPR